MKQDRALPNINNHKRLAAYLSLLLLCPSRRCRSNPKHRIRLSLKEYPPQDPPGGVELPSNPLLNVVPLSLEAALEWTLSCNPDLVALRQNINVSADALEVARRFPTSLNPTVSVDVRPWVFERGADQNVDQIAPQISVSWMQPLEFGHRTAYRTSIAQAAYSQTTWTIFQNELLSMVQTYRLHQMGIYRHEKYRIAVELAEFNQRLVQALTRQMQANQISAADVVLAEVETKQRSSM